MSQIINDKKIHNIYEAANMNFSYLRLQAHCFFNFNVFPDARIAWFTFLRQGGVRSSTLLDQLPKVRALLYFRLEITSDSVYSLSYWTNTHYNLFFYEVSQY